MPSAEVATIRVGIRYTWPRIGWHWWAFSVVRLVVLIQVGRHPTILGLWLIRLGRLIIYHQVGTQIQLTFDGRELMVWRG